MNSLTWEELRFPLKKQKLIINNYEATMVKDLITYHFFILCEEFHCLDEMTPIHANRMHFVIIKHHLHNFSLEIEILESKECFYFIPFNNKS